MKRAVWLLGLAACGHDAAAPAPPPEHAAELGGGIVARVGTDVIPDSLVASVARAQNLAPRAAMDALVDDALAAEGARAAKLPDDPDVHWPLVAARARLTAARMRDDARAKGPPTDAEIAALTARHWRRLDVPEGMRVVHAVVLFPTKRTPEKDAAAHAMADRVAAAVTGARDAQDFQTRASAVPTQKGIDTRVETLSFVEDGRSLDQDVSLEPTFVAAAATLRAPGDRTRVETRYGWHVLQLDAKLPAQRVPLAERRVLLEGEAYAVRARAAYDEALDGLRRDHAVFIATTADALMQTVPLDAPSVE